MNKIITGTLIIIFLSVCVLPAAAQNPFTSKSQPPKASQKQAMPNHFLAKISFWQHQLNQKMAELVRQAKETESMKPFFFLFIIAFSYGVLHAAGPGHGKAVAASYIISQKGKVVDSLLFGNMIALFHGFSGILLVLIVYFVLNSSVSGTLLDVSRITQIISYSLILLLGAVLLTKSIYSWYRRTIIDRRYPDGYTRGRKIGSFATAFVVGMIPCPGVVLVMLFSVSMDMIGLGFLLALSMTMGMAVTISAVVVIGTVGKNLALGALQRRRDLAGIVGQIIETIAALMIMALGALFLAAAF
jgi:ABC-type nickel/cobalt efflux system permease component RcnA